MDHSSAVVKTKEVIGVPVKNASNEGLGKIEELIISKVSGQVSYAVLSFGGFLGMGDKFFALPWNTLKYNAQENCFMLNVEKQKLQNAPGFDKNNWPNWADQQFVDSIAAYYQSSKVGSKTEEERIL